MNLEAELEKLKACIHCGMCLSSCPTYRVTGSEAESPRGRLYLMKHFLDESLPAEKKLKAINIEPHLDQCLGCLGCQTVCPSGVEYGDLLMATREKLAPTQKGRGFRRWVFQHVLPNPMLLQMGSAVLRAYQRTGLQELVRKLGFLKMLPPIFHAEQLIPILPNQPQNLSGKSFGDVNGRRVVLMTGCVMDSMYRHIHQATIDVLIANGYRVMIPEPVCCGALAHHGGEVDIAKDLAKKTIMAVLKEDPEFIVLNSAGCGSAMKEYDQLLADDLQWAEKAQWVSERVIDVMALLAQKPLAPMDHGFPLTVTYHAACHLYHAQKVRMEPEVLLAQIPGVELVPLVDKEFCCGSAGVYNLSHPDLSDEILAMKLEKLKATNADVVVTGNPGCMMQLEKGMREINLPITVAHPIELLAEAYRKVLV